MVANRGKQAARHQVVERARANHGVDGAGNVFMTNVARFLALQVFLDTEVAELFNESHVSCLPVAHRDDGAGVIQDAGSARENRIELNLHPTPVVSIAHSGDPGTDTKERPSFAVSQNSARTPTPSICPRSSNNGRFDRWSVSSSSTSPSIDGHSGRASTMRACVRVSWRAALFSMTGL